MASGYIPAQVDRPEQVDPSTWARMTIEYEHHEIHAGNMFTSSVYASDFDAQSSLCLAFRTPTSSKRIHLYFEASATTFAELELFEAPTITSGTGTPVPIHNRHRPWSAQKRSTVGTIDNPSIPDYVTQDPTITNENVRLHGEMVGSGRGNSGSVSSYRGEYEWVLLPGVLYAIRLAGNGVGGANQIASICATWYEHEDKDIVSG